MKSVVEALLDVLTLVMRNLGSQLRNTGYNLAPGHFRVLGILADGPHHLGELAELQAVSAPTMSNSVTTLESRGWVRRVQDPEDRRRVLIELTDSGQTVLIDIRAQLLNYGLTNCPDLTEDECERVLEALSLIRKLFPEAVD
jgi:DNA-binding MarR family transcriptional regulator